MNLPEDSRPYQKAHIVAGDLDEARNALAIRVEEIARDARRRIRLGSQDTFFRLAVRLPGTEPLEWLKVQANPVRVFWSGRDDDEEIAGAGYADLFTEKNAGDHNSIVRRLHSSIASGDGDLRYFGGIRFDHGTDVDACWKPYGQFQFVLPRFEIRSQDGNATLICNLAFPRDFPAVADIQRDLRSMRFAGHTNGVSNEPLSRYDEPGRVEWREQVELALTAIERNELEKIVLARKSTFQFQQQPDPIDLLDRARKSMPGCFHFLFQPHERTAFIGASPERLYERLERAVWSEAVAGTRPRGGTDHEDHALAEELLLSDKDRREHEFVRRSIIAGVGPYSTSYSVDTAPSVMRFSHGLHLLARLKATLRRDVTDTDLLQSLHPTPAVGGVPRKKALQQIDNLEPFDRGWYAGPVGWVGNEGAEFAVAIRSGLIYDTTLALFSGAGIVRGSEWEKEWDEIEQKITGFTSLF